MQEEERPWYVCLDFDQQFELAGECYQDALPRLFGRGEGLSIRRFIQYEHIYLVVYGVRISEKTRSYANTVLLGYHQKHGVPFVELADTILASLLARRAEKIKHATPERPLVHDGPEAVILPQDPALAARPREIAPPGGEETWYLCLDFGEREAMALRCYQEAYARVKVLPFGISAQRLMLEENYYLLVIGDSQRIPEPARLELTRLFLSYHDRHRVEFVALPSAVLAKAQGQQERLRIEQVRTGKSFTETRQPIIEEIAALGQGVRRIAPPTLPSNGSHNGTSRSKAKQQAELPGKGKPLIERVITSQRMLGEGKDLTPDRVYHRQVARILAGIEHLYDFMPSACSMVEYLRRPLMIGESYQLTLTPGHLWIRFPQGYTVPQLGQVRALYLIQTSDHRTFMETVRSFDVPREALEDFKQTTEHEKAETRVLVIVGEDRELWNGYYEREGEVASWKITHFHICATGQCRSAKVPGGTSFFPCDICKGIFAFWTSWLSTASQLINGEFQEREEPAEREEAIEQTERKEPRPGKPNKFEMKQVTHRYQVVRFDACMKPAKARRAKGEEIGSWVEAAQAIDPTSIVYVDKHVGKTERKLQHPRFVHKRGQVVKVKAHDKKVPMKLATLRRRVVRVVASKFEGGSSDANAKG